MIGKKSVNNLLLKPPIGGIGFPHNAFVMRAHGGAYAPMDEEHDHLVADDRACLAGVLRMTITAVPFSHRNDRSMAMPDRWPIQPLH